MDLVLELFGKEVRTNDRECLIRLIYLCRQFRLRKRRKRRIRKVRVKLVRRKVCGSDIGKYVVWFKGVEVSCEVDVGLECGNDVEYSWTAGLT
jgi:hypothetical protein